MKKIIVVCLVTFSIIVFMYAYAIKREEKSNINVRVVTPEIKTVSDYITANGRVKAENKQNIFVDKPAQIEKIYVKIGDNVKKGDVLLKINYIDIREFDLREVDFVSDDISELIEQYNDITEAKNVYFESTVIKSPMDGTVTGVNIVEGDKICSINKLLSISDFSDLYVDALIPEEYYSELKKGSDVTITSPAFENKNFKGEISYVYPTAKYVPDITGGGKTYIRAKISFKNEMEMLRPEMSVNAKIVVKTFKDALVIPYECILQDDKNREYVFCVEKSKANKRYIISGYELDNELQIKSGINKNSKVIINPPEDLEDKQQISIVEQIK